MCGETGPRLPDPPRRTGSRTALTARSGAPAQIARLSTPLPKEAGYE